jgi:hypothetical protein
MIRIRRNPVRNKNVLKCKKKKEIDFDYFLTTTARTWEIIKSDFSVCLFFIYFLFFLFNFTRLLLAGVAEDVQSRHACPNCHRTYKLRRLVFRHLRKGCDLATTETMANYHGYKTPLPAFRCNFCPFITFIREFQKTHNQEEHDGDCQPSLKRA